MDFVNLRKNLVLFFVKEYFLEDLLPLHLSRCLEVSPGGVPRSGSWHTTAGLVCH